MENETLSITNVCGGAVDEYFQRELAHVLKNVADANTDPEAVRKITLEFTIHPFKDRSAAQIELAVKSKTAGVNSIVGTMFLQRKADNNMIALNHDPRQARLFISPDNSQKPQ